jgi:UDP-2-acetamido-2-deoxy-ribo-hexuluronate aminotransferase
VQFIDLKKQYDLYKDEIRAEVDGVLESCRYIMGPAVSGLEEELAQYAQVKHAIGCSSGTDAILLALLALDLKPGDEVIVPDLTFFATAETVSLLGGVPVFSDILSDTYNIDPSKIEAKIGPKTRGIIAVSLYGQCADFDALCEIADKHELFLLEDGAQSFGGTYRGRKSCGLTEIATTSFYPAKPLGAYGDGGAVFTSSDALAEKIRVVLNHGQTGPYQHSRVGINGRLDSLQAAVLRVKLRHFDAELEKRRQAADWYNEELAETVATPVVREGNCSSWAQYTVRHGEREKIIAYLKSKGIPTAIHYPIPVSSQKAYAGSGSGNGECPNAFAASQEVFSLPMHPFITRDEIREVASAIREALL